MFGRFWAVVGVILAVTAIAQPVARAAEPLAAGAADVAVRLARTDRVLEAVSHRLDAASARLDTAQAALDLTDGLIADNRQKVDRVVGALKDTAVSAYVRHGAASAAVASVRHIEDLDRGDTYTSAVTDVDTADLAGLQRIEDSLERARSDRATLRDDASRERDALADEQGKLAATRARDRQELDRWGAIPVMGDAVLTAAQLAAWYRSTGAVPRLSPGTTIDDLARIYIEEGDAEHVRGDLAFAQAIIETGSFAVAAGDNFSGIGVCDSCTGGNAFDSPRSGVRAQIQLLRNYADPDSRAENLAYPPEPGLYGSDAAKAARLYDTFFLKGEAPLWNLMGNGNWATDPTYAGKVVGLFNSMVSFAAGLK